MVCLTYQHVLTLAEREDNRMASMASASDRPPASAAQQSQAQPQAQRAIDTQEWRTWLRGMLIRRGYAAETTDARTGAVSIHYYLTPLAAAIAAAQPDVPPVSIETLRNVVYRKALPSHATARGLAAALGVSEIAILLRSGQLDWDAVMPLLGPVPMLLHSEAEYHDATHCLNGIDDLAFRERVREMVDHEWSITRWLAGQLRWLGITPAEWETMRRELNDPKGRAALRMALEGAGGDSAGATQAAPPVPGEFTRMLDSLR